MTAEIEAHAGAWWKLRAELLEASAAKHAEYSAELRQKVQSALARQNAAEARATQLSAALTALQADLAAAVSRVEKAEGASVISNALKDWTFAVQHNPNCPSPWLVRMPGKSMVIDMKPYASFGPLEKDEMTGDILGFGKTFGEAAAIALEKASKFRAALPDAAEKGEK